MNGEGRKTIIRFGAVPVAVAAAAARAAYLFKFQHNPFFDYYPKGFDQRLLLNGALEIAGGNVLGPLASEKHAVLYKYLIAIPFVIFGRNFWAVWCFQFAMGVLIALVVYRVGKRCFGDAAGLLAGLWYALYGPALFFEGQMLREQLLCLFVILTAYFLTRIRRGDPRDRPQNDEAKEGANTGFAPAALIAAALTLSLALQTRPNALLIFPFALLYLWLANSDLNRRRRLAALFIFTAIFALVSLPLLIRAIYVHGRFVFYDESGPFVFFLGNLPDYGGVGWEISPLYQAFIAKAGGEPALTWRMALGWLADLYISNPLALPAVYLRKLYFTFNSYEYPSNLNYYLFLKLSPLMKAPWSNFSVVTGFGVVGMVAGFFGIGEQKGRAALYLLLLGVLAGIVLFYPVDRFRMPMAPLMMIFGSYGIVKIIGATRNRLFLKAFFMLAAAIGVTFSLKIPGTIPGQIRPEDFLNMGWAYMENTTHQDYENAEYYLIQSWNESTRRDYSINRAGKAIGTLERHLAAKDINAGRYESAVLRLKCAGYTDLCNSETEQLLAMALRGLGRANEANEADEESARLKETLPKEMHLELAYRQLSLYALNLAYCHLLTAAILEEDPDLKKELQTRVTEIFVKIQTLPLDSSQLKTPEY